MPEVDISREAVASLIKRLKTMKSSYLPIIQESIETLEALSERLKKYQRRVALVSFQYPGRETAAGRARTHATQGRK